jgi:hypothetical protein
MEDLKMLMTIYRYAAPIAGVLLLFATLPNLLKATTLPRGFHIPGLLLELVENEDEVKAVEKVKLPDKIRRDLWIDTLGFIPFYTFLFLVIGYWLMKRDVPFAFALGVIACVGIVLVAGFDLLENARIFSVLKASSPQLVDGIRHAALGKWGLMFALVLMISYPFLRSGGWLLAVGLVYLIAAVVGLLGVFWHRPLVEWGFMLVALSMLVSGEAVRYIPAKG